MSTLDAASSAMATFAKEEAGNGSTSSNLDVFADLTPGHSKEVYEKAWDNFLMFAAPEASPSEEDFARYFQHLKKDKGMKSSSLWAIFSRLNSCYKQRYGDKLQRWPRLVQLLKTYNAGYERKCANTFSLQEINAFLAMELNSRFWILRKAAVCLSIAGGLRCCELRSLKIGSIKDTSDGLLVNYQHAKQKGEVKHNKFLVPRNPTHPAACMYSNVKAYFNLLLADLKEDDQDPSLDLFRCCTKVNKYGKQPMGVNYLSKIGKEVAEVLKLPNASSYTGHCFRRSSATFAANQGATAIEMQKHFGWKQPSTALRYIDGTLEGSKKMASRFISATNDNKENGAPVPSTSTHIQIVQSQSTAIASEPVPDKCVSESGQKVYHVYCQPGANVHFH